MAVTTKLTPTLGLNSRIPTNRFTLLAPNELPNRVELDAPVSAVIKATFAAGNMMQRTRTIPHQKVGVDLCVISLTDMYSNSA